jgi:hypothetical protein
VVTIIIFHLFRTTEMDNGIACVCGRAVEQNRISGSGTVYKEEEDGRGEPIPNLGLAADDPGSDRVE